MSAESVVIPSMLHKEYFVATETKTDTYPFHLTYYKGNSYSEQKDADSVEITIAGNYQHRKFNLPEDIQLVDYILRLLHIVYERGKKNGTTDLKNILGVK